MGLWPAAWPASLTLTASGGCCSRMNFSVSLPRDGSNPAIVKYGGAVFAGETCNRSNILFPGVSLVCSNPNDGWLLNGGYQPECAPVGGSSLVFTVRMTLISCKPFHAIGAMSFAINPSFPTACCNGTLNLEVTE